MASARSCWDEGRNTRPSSEPDAVAVWFFVSVMSSTVATASPDVCPGMLSRRRQERELGCPREARESPESIFDRRCLVAAMHHAFGAFLIFRRTVVLPCRRVHEIAEALGIAFLQEITGPLPAEHVIRGVSPRRAVIFAASHQEVQEERGLIELPRALRTRENLGKQLFRPGPLEEMLLVRRFLVAVAGRNHHAFDAQRHHLVEEFSDTLRIRIIE